MMGAEETMSQDNKVVDFPVTPEERARQLKAEVERLAAQSPTEWMFWLNDRAAKHGIDPSQLKAMIEATIKAKEKQAREQKAEEQRREQRVEKQRNATRQEEERKQREQQRAQEKADKAAAKEAERKQREKTKTFKELIRLPIAKQETRLAELATRLGGDLELLRDEFAEKLTEQPNLC
jgi:hypothetical protein